MSAPFRIATQPREAPIRRTVGATPAVTPWRHLAENDGVAA